MANELWYLSFRFATFFNFGYSGCFNDEYSKALIFRRSLRSGTWAASKSEVIWQYPPVFTEILERRLQGIPCTRLRRNTSENWSALTPNLHPTHQHKLEGWGQQESKPHSVQRPEGRRTAYLCRCDYPWHRPELSCRLAAHEPDARGGCGLPPVLSTLAHGDFPRSVCNRSKLLVCQLRSRASRAPRALHLECADMISQITFGKI